MAIYKEDAIIIESEMDLESEMCKYNCKTVEELDEYLWFTYGVGLILKYKQNEEQSI